MKIVTVMPLKKGVWKEDLTYFTAKEIQNGSIVTVPLRKKNILGLVISVEEVSNSKINIKDLAFNLKKVIDVKEQSIFSKEYLDSALDTSRYFASNKYVTTASLIPSAFIENYDKITSLVEKKSEPGAPNANAIKITAEKLLLQLPFDERISIYKTLIRENFASKKSVFIVLPTERDIQIFYDALSKSIEQFTFCMHSGLGLKKTINLFKDISNSTHPLLLIGTAPFLSIKRDDLGVIILEHESSTAYKNFVRPYIDLRTFVEIFASKIHAKLILSDTLLRFETIARRDTENLQPMHPLSFRLDFNGEINIASTDTKKTSKKFEVLTEESFVEIQKNLNGNKKVFVFSLRKGLATMTTCRDCGTMVSCQNCLAPVVLQNTQGQKNRILVCSKCKTHFDADTHCENCGGWNLVPLGIGTDTVEEYLKDKKYKTFKLDKESAKSAQGALQIVADFEESENSVLIGTEMAFFYLHNSIDLSVIASFDSLWGIPSFKISEKILQIIISILNKTKDKLIIQTKNEHDGALQAIKNGNLLSFVREELEDRKKLGYPPFKRFIKITHTSNSADKNKIKEFLADFFKEYNPEIFNAFHSTGKDKTTTNALIKISPEKWSLEGLSLNSTLDENLLKKLTSLPASFSVFVDPEDLL